MASNGTFESRVFVNNVTNYLNATGLDSVAIEQLIGSANGYVRARAADAASESGTESGRGATLLSFGEAELLPSDLDEDYFYLRGRSTDNEQYPSCPVEAPCAAPINDEVADLAAGLKEYFEAHDDDYENVEVEDWGSAWLVQRNIVGQDLYLVRVTTDGDDGYLELFDATGRPLAIAETVVSDLYQWGDRLGARRTKTQP